MLTVLSPPHQVQPILDRRLDKGTSPPVALALSGGGDSMALLHIAADWAGSNGRRLLALHVDHQLNPASGDWASMAERAARRLGADFQRLAWTGAKPISGLPAAARAARHGLLADAARAAGAKVILMGHTADDVLEAAIMRRSGGSVGAPRQWSPSPAWPQGRGVFLLRPMLAVRRAALRDHLSRLGETWIEDPANSDPRFARSRARAALGDAEPPPDEDDLVPGPLIWREIAGALAATRADVRATDARQIAAACLCASGTMTPPRGDRLKRLVQRLQGDEVFTAGLAGARIEADAGEVRVMREIGEIQRNGGQPLNLRQNEASVWDGRFEVLATEAAMIRPLAGMASRLDPDARAALLRLPPGVRPALPVVVAASGAVTCPILAETSSVHFRTLALERFMAFCGYMAAES